MMVILDSQQKLDHQYCVNRNLWVDLCKSGEGGVIQDLLSQKLQPSDINNSIVEIKNQNELLIVDSHFSKEYENCYLSFSTSQLEIKSTLKVKAASGRLSFERGYNQTCQWYHNLWADMPKLHAKFHQNRWCRFGEKCEQDTDNV